MTSAAAALSGQAAAPAAAPAPAAPDAAGGTPSAAPAPASNDAWYTGIQNPDVRVWAEAKGFKDPLAVAESAYNLEKLMGFDRAGRTIVVPDEKATPEQVQAFRAKIGVPEAPDGYKLKIPEGVPQEFAGEASKWFHEAGIPAKAAESITEKWNAYQTAQAKAQAEAFATRSANEYKEWSAEQGQALAQQEELARRAVTQFLPAKDANERQAKLDAIERAVGTRTMMEFFAKVGAGLAEHTLHGGNEPGGGGKLTPAVAQQRINELKSNREWSKAYLEGDKAKAAEMQELIAMAYPVGS